jgi:hypothetical protein
MQFPMYHVPLPYLGESNYFLQKHPGSPKQQSEKSSTKPPLPINPTQFRKGAYHDSLEFVQSLCDTSYGLVDVFPIEDRKSALQEVIFLNFSFLMLSSSI